MEKKSNTQQKERHILALSGGKDSAALVVYMREKWPDLKLEYVFTDSGCELPETYRYLNRIRALLNIEINILQSKQDFDYWLKYFNGVLPSPQNRWCTRLLKLEPFEAYIGDDFVYSYVALRADENREGYRGKNHIIPVYPFIEDGIVIADVEQILKESELGFPSYYRWRKRSGCYFCFFQTEAEWLGLKKHHPELFEKACIYEETHSDKRQYTWRQAKRGESGFLRSLNSSLKLSQNRSTKQKTKTLRELLKDNRLNLCHGHNNCGLVK